MSRSSVVRFNDDQCLGSNLGAGGKALTMVQAFKRGFRQMDTWPIEMLYCFLTGAWGVTLLLPGDAMNADSFAPMRWVAQDWKWGVLAMVIASVRFYGANKPATWARLSASLAGGLIWSFTWMTMLGVTLTTGKVTTGIAVYGVLSCANLVLFVKLCRALLGKKHYHGRRGCIN